LAVRSPTSTCASCSPQRSSTATRHRRSCILLLLNGLRVSKVCKPNIEDLQREPGGGYPLLVRGKGAKHASVALNASAQLAVLAVAGTRSS
jgi:site-specific recombinase XerD